jgi:hypothetical protein
MNQPKCNVTLKNKKANISEAKQRISKFIKSSKVFLNKICPNAGACITIGSNVDDLTQYFNGFTKFDNITRPLKRIGAVSVNGFINEIEYDKNGYKAHTILKSSQKATADNLVYEYIVGMKFVNRQIKSFPCFVQTYGLYFYDTALSWRLFKKTKNLDKNNLQHLILQNKIDYDKACKESKHASILIQHIHDAKSITDMMSNHIFVNNDLLHVLYPLYHTLSSLSKTFTHYDLHPGNVLLYKPKDNHYIQYHYHYEDGTTQTFLSAYIPKIIDYGRSYFDNGNLNGRSIYNKVCATRKCNPRCGKKYGFTWLDPTPYIHISSSIKNESHDLRLLNTVKLMIAHASPLHTFVELKSIVDKIMYGVGLTPRYRHFGTSENLTMATDQHIYNVNSAFLELKKAISNVNVVRENNDRYVGQTKLGDLHVYNDGRPMKYEQLIRI